MEKIETMEEIDSREIAILLLLDKYLKNNDEEEINILLSKLDEIEKKWNFKNKISFFIHHNFYIFYKNNLIFLKSLI